MGVNIIQQKRLQCLGVWMGIVLLRESVGVKESSWKLLDFSPGIDSDCIGLRDERLGL